MLFQKSQSFFHSFIFLPVFKVVREGGGVNLAICKTHSEISVYLCGNKLVWHWTVLLWKCLSLIEILMRIPVNNNREDKQYLFLEVFFFFFFLPLTWFAFWSCILTFFLFNFAALIRFLVLSWNQRRMNELSFWSGELQCHVESVKAAAWQITFSTTTAHLVMPLGTVVYTVRRESEYSVLFCTCLTKWLELRREITAVEFLIDNLNVFNHPWLSKGMRERRSERERKPAHLHLPPMHTQCKCAPSSLIAPDSQPWMKVRFHSNIFE